MITEMCLLIFECIFVMSNSHRCAAFVVISAEVLDVLVDWLNTFRHFLHHALVNSFCPGPDYGAAFSFGTRTGPTIPAKVELLLGLSNLFSISWTMTHGRINLTEFYERTQAEKQTSRRDPGPRLS